MCLPEPSDNVKRLVYVIKLCSFEHKKAKTFFARYNGDIK